MNGPGKQHRLAKMLGLSLAVHLLAICILYWSNLINPAVRVPSTKLQPLSLAFIRPQLKPFAEVAPVPMVPDQPQASDLSSNRAAPTINPAIPNPPANEPNHRDQQPENTSLVNAPPAPPRLPAPESSGPAALAYSPSAPIEPNRRPLLDTSKAGLNDTIVPSLEPQPAALKTASAKSLDKEKLAAAQPQSLPDTDRLDVRLPAQPTQSTAHPLLQQAKQRLADSQRSAAGSFTPPPIMQPGGVTRHGRFKMDVEMPLYGDYDERMINAIALRWIDLNFQAQIFTSYRVVIAFEQTAQGAIEQMRVESVNFKKPANAADQDIPSYLCCSSVTGLSPFQEWPQAMRQDLGADRRRCRITYIYNIIPR